MSKPAVPENFLRDKKYFVIEATSSFSLHFLQCLPHLPAKSTLNPVLLASSEVPPLVFSSFSFFTLSTLSPRD
jgi:hypothetical protein